MRPVTAALSPDRAGREFDLAYHFKHIDTISRGVFRLTRRMLDMGSKSPRLAGLMGHWERLPREDPAHHDLVSALIAS